MCCLKSRPRRVGICRTWAPRRVARMRRRRAKPPRARRRPLTRSRRRFRRTFGGHACPGPAGPSPGGTGQGVAGAAANAADTIDNNLGAIYVSYLFGPFGLLISEGPTSISDGMGGFLTNRDYRKWRRDPKHSVCFRASQLTAGSWDTYLKPARLVLGYRSTRPGSFSHIPYPPD
jgi:hypothetical protein